jgi:hypothetical protein
LMFGLVLLFVVSKTIASVDIYWILLCTNHPAKKFTFTGPVNIRYLKECSSRVTLMPTSSREKLRNWEVDWLASATQMSISRIRIWIQ